MWQAVIRQKPFWGRSIAVAAFASLLVVEAAFGAIFVDLWGCLDGDLSSIASFVAGY